MVLYLQSAHLALLEKSVFFALKSAEPNRKNHVAGADFLNRPLVLTQSIECNLNQVCMLAKILGQCALKKF